MAWSLLRSSTDRSDCESCGKNDGAPELTRRGLPRLMSASWREAAVPAAAPYGKLPPFCDGEPLMFAKCVPMRRLAPSRQIPTFSVITAQPNVRLNPSDTPLPLYL
jgi:hypothetical protein